MEIIRKLTKDSLTELISKKQLSTPENYFKEFKKQAESSKVEIEELHLFEELNKTLTEEELSNFYEVESYNDLAILLARRASNEDIKKLLFVLEELLTPSIDMKTKRDIESFLKTLSNNPQAIFERDSIQTLKDITNKRVDLDKDVLRKKTDDIIKIISLVSKHFDKTLLESSDATKEVVNIRDELKSLNISKASQREVGVLQAKLIDTLFSIENSFNNNNEMLTKSKDKFKELNETIAKLQEDLEEAKKQSETDFLTGLLNRRAYEDELIKIEKKHEIFNSKYAIVFFDLDRFKDINDKHGHECGDKILKKFSTLLSEITRNEDVVARYGGEEFISLINYKNKEEVRKYIYRIKKIIESSHFKIEDKIIFLKFSAGVVYRNTYNSYEESMKIVDILLTKAKETGRNKILFDDGTEINSVLV